MTEMNTMTLYRRPLHLLMVLLCAIFAAEFIIMMFLDCETMPWLCGWVESLIDAGVLSIVLFPLLYFLVYQPLLREVAELEEMGAVLRDDQSRLEARVRERTVDLEWRNHEISTLAKMSRFLQACTSITEAYDVITRTGRRLFPDAAGYLFVYSASRNDLELVASWGGLTLKPDEHLFTPEECWALRCGRVSFFDDHDTCISCRHVKSPELERYICVPVIAQGEVMGVLHLRPESGATGWEGDTANLNKRWAVTLSEHIALALTNLRLRETLRNQSIRDPLTGLFNRRYLEETLEREVTRAVRKGHPLAVVMLDVDHFKRFNDTHGHEAGDVLLREIGSLFNQRFREGDVASRYGGEEFTLALPEMSQEIACERVDRLLRDIRQLSARHQGELLGKVTASAGIAMYPQHGGRGEDLLRVADRALYQAKAAGRDRLILAESLPTDLELPTRSKADDSQEVAPIEWHAAATP